MDSITHLAAGAISPLVFRKAPRMGAVVIFGIIAGEFPDIDAVAGSSAQAMLVIHRSFTHSIPAILVFSLLLALLFRQILRRLPERRRTVRVDNGVAVLTSPADWPLREIWLAALLALALHVYLDCMTTFGTQIFWPVSDFRVAFPAVYIIDPLFTLPLLVLLVYVLINMRRPEPPRQARLLRLAHIGLAWIICYPLACLGLHAVLQAKINADFAVAGSDVEKITLSTTPLSPFRWKAIGENELEYRLAQVNVPGVLGEAKPSFGAGYKKPPCEQWDALREALPIFDSYAKFASFPVLRKDITIHFSMEEGENISPLRILTFEDLRYTPSGPEDLMHLVGRGDGMFLLQVRLELNSNSLLAWRYLPLAAEAASRSWVEVEPVPLP